ncbi:MAG: hypothetical protein WA094_01405 [Candidatus Desulfobacillus denitrificans]
MGTSLIRFAIAAIDSDSGHRTGILVAAHDLRDEGELSVLEHDVVRLELAWFNINLPIPPELDSEEHRRAISWFKPSANEAIQRMWRLKAILGVHGIDVDVLKTEDPGVIVYEDNFQVIAKPRKGRRF